MNTINEVTLLGSLGEDPQIRTANNGTTIASFSLATSDSYKDSNGDWQKKTDWHKVTVFGKTAEIASQYLTKGSRVHVTAKLKYDSYEKDGRTIYKTDIIGNRLILLDKKESYQKTEQTKITEDVDDVPF